jgi:hypothetical protein
MYGISFCGDMEERSSAIGADDWERISIAKVKEAYTEFMEKKGSTTSD